MLTDTQKHSIVKSWRLVVPIAETAADLFYRRLFELKPDYRGLFPEDMATQKRKLVTMLSFIVKSIDWGADEWADDVDPENDLALVVMAMGRRHKNLYRIPDDSYAPVGAALLWTLEQGLGDAFDDDLKAAWASLYGTLSITMRLGAGAGRVEMSLGQKN